MSTPIGPFHRLGEPGGDGCPVGVLQVAAKDSNGKPINAQLLDGGSDVAEVEILRTIASRLGVQWGRDELGWWALVTEIDFPSWAVWRQDDSGNEYLMASNITEIDAKKLVAEFEEKGHKQTYWCSDTKTQV
ncbi:hypothetical protein [Roseibacillus persicicus]|uniref:Uncharacterized protein n=1 Tax=Roseibacillus persicicus TaxID=454148 RepID=A0A918U2Y6_9BACT|nr:hypothetical protein [Roseibacillus persicicus]GHC69101.1 hypothetical protein GCM10007100_40640 [Roseibacillus persicicus]